MVASRIGGSDGKVVVAICQRRVRGEGPLTVAVSSHGTQDLAAVADSNNIASRRRPVQGRGAVVGGLAFLQRTDMRFAVIDHAGDRRLCAGRDQQRNVVRRSFTGDAVTGRILGFQGQAVQAFQQRCIRGHAPVTGAVNHRRANQVGACGIGGVNKHDITGAADTADDRQAVVGDITAGDVALQIADIIRHGGDFQAVFGGNRRGVVGGQNKVV